MKIFIEGASGRIGKELVKVICTQNFSLTLLGRNSQEIIDIASIYKLDSILHTTFEYGKDYIKKSDILINCSQSSVLDRLKNLEICLAKGLVDEIKYTDKKYKFTKGLMTI